MPSYESLAKRLLDGKTVTLDYQKNNYGTDNRPDILIARVSAVFEEKDMVVYLSMENVEEIMDTYEIYRMPKIDNLDQLKSLLPVIKSQAHPL